jgi:hypothetical protein
MKRLTTLLITITLLSCSADSVNEEELLDCECDRIQAVMSFNIVPNKRKYIFDTVNDCTGYTRSWDITIPSSFPPYREGDCK